MNRTVSALPSGTSFARLVMCLAKSEGDFDKALAYATPLRDTPTVKAAVEAMTAGTSSAAVLTSYGLDAELVALINTQTILGRCLARMRRWPFRVRVPVETAASGGGWIAGYATPIAVSRPTLAAQVLDRFRAAAIVALDNELLDKIGDPSSEAAVRQSVVAGVASYMDGQFLDPAVALVAEQNPASITRSAATVTSGGVTGDQLLADFVATTLLVTTEFNAPVWIMRPSVAKKLAGKYLATGARAFPELNVATGGSILGIPVVLSRNVPAASGSPTANIVVLADLAEIAAADDGETDISVSRVTTLALNSAPASPANMTSMFQTETTAIKVVRTVSWLRLRNEAVAVLDNLAL